MRTAHADRAMISVESSGKGRIVAAIVRLLEFSDGNSTIDGTDLAFTGPELLRSRINCTIQELFLFHSSCDIYASIA